MLPKRFLFCFLLTGILLLGACGGSVVAPPGLPASDLNEGTAGTDPAAADGQAGGQAGEQANGRAGEQAEKQADGQAGKQADGRAGEQADGIYSDEAENNAGNFAKSTSNADTTNCDDRGASAEASAEMPPTRGPGLNNENINNSAAPPDLLPGPAGPQETETPPAAYTCTLAVRCDAILSNLERLNPEKVELVPEDGIIFSPREVTFYEGESVFNVFQREMKRAKIHMEFVNVPVYKSAYIKGINNLYECDCGELSGWTYKVNGRLLDYGSSCYQLHPEDMIEILYTCDLGRDVGGETGS